MICGNNLILYRSVVQSDMKQDEDINHHHHPSWHPPLLFPLQMKTSVREDRCVAVPPATTHWAASSVCVPPALTLSRAPVAARMWMNVAQAPTPASTAAPTPTEATCVAVLEVSTEPARGEGTQRKIIEMKWCSRISRMRVRLKLPEIN